MRKKWIRMKCENFHFGISYCFVEKWNCFVEANIGTVTLREQKKRESFMGGIYGRDSSSNVCLPVPRHWFETHFSFSLKKKNFFVNEHSTLFPSNVVSHSVFFFFFSFPFSRKLDHCFYFGVLLFIPNTEYNTGISSRAEHFSCCWIYRIWIEHSLTFYITHWPVIHSYISINEERKAPKIQI